MLGNVSPSMGASRKEYPRRRNRVPHRRGSSVGVRARDRTWCLLSSSLWCPDCTAQSYDRVACVWIRIEQHVVQFGICELNLAYLIVET